MENKQIKDMMEKAAGAIEKLAAEKLELQNENAALKKQLDESTKENDKHMRKQACEEIANIMIEKGLIGYSDFQSEVEKMANSGDDVALLKKVAEKMTDKTAATFDFYGDSSKGKTADQIAEERFAAGK